MRQTLPIHRFFTTILFLAVTTLTWAYDFAVDGIYYDKNADGTSVTVTYKTSSDRGYSGSVVIPSTVTYGGKTYSVKSIGSYAFYGCSGLTSVTIPESVTSIGDWAFRECSGLTSVTIPNSVTSIDYYAFSYCSGLTSVTIPESVTSIGSGAFLYCSGLTSVTIPESVTSIGSNAFRGCSGLTSVTIPNSVTSIGYQAFEECTGLTSVTIPNSVTSIGRSAFSGCTGLTSVTCHAQNVPATGTNVFYNVPQSSATLYVPAESVDAYKSASQWKDFGTIRAIGEVEDFSVDGIYYHTNPAVNTAYVTYKDTDYNSYSGSVVIPSTVAYGDKTYDVTSIGSSAFKNSTGLTSVSIGNNVTSIGSDAFSGCTGLASVAINSNAIVSKTYTSSSNLRTIFGSQVKEYVLGDNITAIGSNAFRDCSGLTSVTIGSGVTSIGSGAFSGCDNLTSIIIDKNNPKYDSRNNCNAIIETESNTLIAGCQNTIIPNSVTSIGSDAFYNCSSLTSVTIPESVTSIGSDAFKGCSGLTSVTIPNSVTNIGNYAFYDCSGLTSVTIPNSVKSIGSYAFYCCSGLTSVTIPESVTSIGSDAFKGCSGLTSVTIPNSVTSIGSNAFQGCMGLTNVTLNSNSIASKTYTSSSNLSAIFGSQVKEYVLGDNITAIGDYAFRGCSGLTSVTFGTGLLSISNNAFGNTKPTKVIWLTNTPPSGYKEVAGTINYVANNQYASLSNTKVYPFLSSIFEVDGVKYVPVSPSERTCDAIDCSYSNEAENIVIGKTVSFKGIDMTVRSINQYTCYQNPYIKNIDLSTNCAVSDASFYGCTALTTATLGKNITGIGSYAFQDCSSLQNIIIPDAVTSLGSYAFSGCSSLGDVHIGSGVTSIGAYAFSGCKALPAIEIPGSVTSIGNYTFSGCTSLKTVIMDGQESVLALGSNGSSPLFSSCPLDSVYIDRPVTYPTSGSYGYSPFYRNTCLRSIHITDKLTEISDNEFYGCTNLKNVRIGNGVAKIGKWAFSGCSSLDYFSFGSGVKEIGQEAFSDCTAMTRLISLAPTPPVCGTQALDDINKWSCTLSVPSGHTAGYQSAEQWKEFFFIRDDAESTGIGDIRTDSSDQPSGEPAIYDLNGRRLQHKPAHGFYIQGGKKYFVK